MTYKIIKWNSDLDLSNFYKDAEERGFYNNSSQKMLVDCFFREDKWSVWILYYNDVAIGSVAAHSFNEVMGNNSFRIAARTCVFTDKLPLNSLRTKNQIVSHQNVTSQFLIPACLDWVPANSRVFITSNNSKVGTQRLVHKIFCPAMEATKQMERVKEVFYRGTRQTVWELFPKKFIENLNKYPRWN